MKRWMIVLSLGIVVAFVAAALVAGTIHPSGQPTTLAEGPTSPAKVTRVEVVRVQWSRGDRLRETFPGISLVGVREDEAGAYLYIAFQTQEQLDAALEGGAMPVVLDGVRVIVDSRPIRVELSAGTSA